ncbi:MAG TPA: hypothetical protein VG265_02795, partial [Gaiellaceae bacterium]|nr:hypothetical protein [Gaiellaceae bacterium]
MARKRLLAVAVLATAAILVGAGESSGHAVSRPVPTTGPTVIGTATVGKRLTGLSGTWAGFGTIGYRFQ